MNLCDRYVDWIHGNLQQRAHPITRSPRYERNPFIYLPPEVSSCFFLRNRGETHNSPTLVPNSKFVGTEFRTVVGRERDDEISGAEQSYQPFVGINHPIQPGDWHSTAPCSGLFVECLISLVFGRCQKCYAFKWPCGIFTYMSLAKQTNGCLGYLGDEMLPSYVGIIINYHYTDKPDPRHPNTSWAGIWTPNTYPKHLLRSCLDVYGNIIFLILILSNWKWSRKKPFPRFPTVFGSINPLPTTKKLLQQNRFQSRENTRTTLNH